jgi:hypothetical protein
LNTKAARDRRLLNSSWNFRLPPDWTEAGTIRLIATVNPAQEVDECSGCFNTRNDMVLTTLIFSDVAPLNIASVPVSLGGNLPTTESLESTFDYLASTYPVAEVNVSASARSLNLKESNPKSKKVLDQLRKCFKIGKSSRTIIYGVLPYGLDFSGMAYLNSRHAIGHGVKGEGRGTTAAHEVGHTQGLKHASCDHGERAGGECEPWPFPHGGIDAADGAGLNTPTLQPVPALGQGRPNLFICKKGGEDLCRRAGVNEHTHDFMSYGGPPKWISILTWERLLEKLRALPLELLASPSAAEYLVVGGSLDTDGRLTLEPFYRIEPPDEFNDGPGSGSYIIELQRANGSVLFARRFEPTPYFEEEGASFSEVLPYFSDTKRIVIRRGPITGPETLAVIEVSNNSPKVNLLTPDGGEFWPASIRQTIAWTASDADGDPLHYAVQYSVDGGQTWHTLAVDLASTELQINPATFAGSDQALIRVLATDEVNTGEDRSNALFIVPNKAPIAVVRSPGNNLAYDSGSVLILQGAATDLEDGPLGGEALSWVSTRDGALGTGRQLAVRNLSIGFHRIILTARDKSGALGQAEVCVHVRP